MIMQTLPVLTSPDGESYIELTPEIIEETGWVEGDVLVWTQTSDTSWTLTKKADQ
jgi:hypothetical protein